MDVSWFIECVSCPIFFTTFDIFFHLFCSCQVLLHPLCVGICSPMAKIWAHLILTVLLSHWWTLSFKSLEERLWMKENYVRLGTLLLHRFLLSASCASLDWEHVKRSWPKHFPPPVWHNKNQACTWFGCLNYLQLLSIYVFYCLYYTF